MAESSDYVDIFLNVKTNSVANVKWVQIAFTIPPNTDQDTWLSYSTEIVNPVDRPEILLSQEIDINGNVTQLDSEYFDWLADSVEAVLAQPQTSDGERPTQRAPRSMY